MTVKFTAVGRRNPQTGELSYYPQKVSGSVVGLDTIADELAEMCTLTRGDVWAVVKNIPLILKRHFANGDGIRLDGLGTLEITLRSHEGRPTADDVDATQIEVHITFYPTRQRTPNGRYIIPMLQGIKFEKVKVTKPEQLAIELQAAEETLNEALRVEGMPAAYLDTLRAKVEAKRQELQASHEDQAPEGVESGESGTFDASAADEPTDETK